MAQAKPQNYANHARTVPPFHFVVLPLLLINFLWSAYRALTAMSTETVMGALFGLAVLMAAVFGRVFALVAQDRVIRLEMRMRLAEILPDDLKSRIMELTTKQLIALRFASDGEMAELVRGALSGSAADQKAIKQQIKDWQADYQRV